MLDFMSKCVQAFQPQHAPCRPGQREAAVLVPLTRAASPQLVLTLRASGLSSHGGEVAFPGGRRDPEDPDLVRTALREAHEEVGLPAHQVEVLGALSSLVSRHGVHVTPYVGLVPEHFDYCANVDEIAAVFFVPLEFFRQAPHSFIPRQDHLGRFYDVPCYYFGEFKIWGLTAAIIGELMALLETGQPVSALHAQKP